MNDALCCFHLRYLYSKEWIFYDISEEAIANDFCNQDFKLFHVIKRVQREVSFVYFNWEAWKRNDLLVISLVINSSVAYIFLSILSECPELMELPLDNLVTPFKVF